MTETIPPATLQLATRRGIETHYEGTDGTTHHASVDALRALLRALGHDVHTDGDAQELLEAETAVGLLEPVSVAQPGHDLTLPLHGLAQLETESATVELTLEDGETLQSPLAALLGSATTGQPDIGAATQLEFGRVGWGDIGPGCHTVSIEAGIHSARGWYVIAPTCPAPNRGWGAFMPLHAVRSSEDWGIGSYSDLAELGRWIDGLGGDFVGTLPLYPVDTHPPIDPSPYLPLSRLAYNELYVDPIAVPEMRNCEAARRFLDTVTTRLAALRANERVDYEGVWAIKSDALALLFDEFLHGSTARQRDLDEFAKAHPELRAYAEHRARRLSSRGVSGPERNPHFQLYVQWVATEQFRTAARSGAPLYADLPVGVRPDGFDTEWAPDAFASGVTGGAPPDAFFAGGQDWGFRPLHPETARRDGYRYVRECLRRACDGAKFLRLDHVAGLHRLFWIPDGMAATDGAYVRYRSEEIRALVRLEAWRTGTIVIGEDLGTVPRSVRSAMRHDGMLRSWVFEFESTDTEPLPSAPSHVLASLSTHDLRRFTTFLEAPDPADGESEDAGQARAEHAQWRGALAQALGLPDGDAAPPESVMAACLASLCAGPADLVLADLEELMGERVAQNKPGTGPEALNWTRRARHSLEEMQHNRDATAFLASLTSLRRAQTPFDHAPLEVTAAC